MILLISNLYNYWHVFVFDFSLVSLNFEYHKLILFSTDNIQTRNFGLVEE